MKKVKLLFVAITMIASYMLTAQGVSINADGSSADGSAMLDVKSTDMGMLIPRMTETQRDDITTPATGLMIFQTDEIAGFYYYDGSAWALVGGTTYSVGDFAQGGIVFLVDETGKHGLVCAKTDQNGGNWIRWYAGTHGDTQAKGDGPYSGKTNTAIIIAAQVAIGDDGSTYAARICNELQITEGGKTYGDWYLPSKEELDLMYQNKATIEATANANGGSNFSLNHYFWSSTEHNNGRAWTQVFSNGSQIHDGTDYSNGVRAVRAF